MTEKERFVLTEESKTAKDGITKLFRLKVAVTFRHKVWGEIKTGTLGGWIKSLKIANGDARVSGDAWVYGNAEVYGDAWVSGDAWVYGNAEVYGDAWVYGDVNLQTVLCSRFSFEFDWQVKLWQKKEKEFEEEAKKKHND